MKTESVLERMFKAGHLAVTSECGPPRGALPDKVREKAEMLRGYVDAVNVTDNQTAMVRMSSLTACILIRQMGLRPDPADGHTRPQPTGTAKRPSGGLRLRASGHYAVPVGRPSAFRGPPDGGQTSTTWTRSSSSRPCAPCGIRENSREAMRSPTRRKCSSGRRRILCRSVRAARPASGKKADAGADFIQTQCIYNLDRFEKWMEGVCKRRLHENLFIMAGITPLKSAGMAAVHEEEGPGHGYARRAGPAARGASQGQTGGGGDHASPSKPSNVLETVRAFTASTSWPSSGSNEFRNRPAGRALPATDRLKRSTKACILNPSKGDTDERSKAHPGRR